MYNALEKLKNLKDFVPVEDESGLPIYVADLETDPFEHGLLVKAFCCGFYDGKDFKCFWGRNWLAQFLSYIENLPKGIIYFHNGGKFDFFHMLKIFDGDLMIINGRIVKAQSFSGHEFRDSYSIMPFALKNYKKTEIDYNKMKVGSREKNKAEIISYLKDDCVYLYELCRSFADTFTTDSGNPPLTIGSASLTELQKRHAFASLSKEQDTEYRKTFYFGGRVQCFQKGIIKAPLKIYDVNSMYPYTMANYQHPIGRPSGCSKKIQRNTCFISVEGKNYGAFPSREKNGGIRFDRPDGIFHVSIHEWRVAIRYGLFEPTRIIRCFDFESRGTFKTFVNEFHNKRNQAKNEGDITRAIFFKYISNSAYGKFAQSSENYKNHKITSNGEQLNHAVWKPSQIEESGVTIWSRPSNRISQNNVATAASITGAARAVLLEAIANATNPVYCDTDSLICEGIANVKFDDKELGAWKLEGEGKKAAVAMKKLYAVFETDKKVIKKIKDDVLAIVDPIKRDHALKAFESKVSKHGYCVKQANKGVRISPSEVVDCCDGKIVTYRRDAPSYKLDGNHVFIERRVRMI